MPEDGEVGGAPTTEAERPNVHVMVVVHRAFRREFPLAARLVRATPPGDTDRATQVAEHIELGLLGLDKHHTAEDTHLWPKLLERAAPHTELINRMERQHQAVHAHVEQAQKVLPGWQAAPTEENAAELATVLDALTEALVEHLDDEESDILPLVSEHISAAEWDQLGQDIDKTIPKPALMILLGSVLEDADAAEQAIMLGSMPATPRLMWKLLGRRQYARYVRRLRG